jgi:hypothetical protein
MACRFDPFVNLIAGQVPAIRMSSDLLWELPRVEIAQHLHERYDLDDCHRRVRSLLF